MYKIIDKTFLSLNFLCRSVNKKLFYSCMSNVLCVTLLHLAYEYKIHVAIEHLKVRMVFANLSTTCNININFYALWKVFFPKSNFRIYICNFLIIRIKYKPYTLCERECQKVIYLTKLKALLDDISLQRPEFIRYESNLFNVQIMHNCYLII